MVFSQKLVKRYLELKKEAPDCLLLIQVGALPILKQAVTGATTLKSKRGEAGDVAPRLLARLEKSL